MDRPRITRISKLLNANRARQRRMPTRLTVPRDTGWLKTLADSRGAASIEKLVLLGVFVFALIAGIGVLARDTRTALMCQGARLLNLQSGQSPACGRGAGGNNASAPVA